MVDQHFPIPKESDYLVRLYAPGKEPAMLSPEDKQKDKAIRALMHEMGMTKEIGSAVAQMALKEDEYRKTLTPRQVEARIEAENDRLRRHYGGQEKLDAALEPAQRMTLEVLKRLEKDYPPLRKYVEGLLDHAMVVAQVVQTARNYHIRKGSK